VCKGEQVNWISDITLGAVSKPKVAYSKFDTESDTSWMKAAEKAEIAKVAQAKSFLSQLKEVPAIRWATPGLVTWVVAYFVGRSLGRDDGCK